MSIITSAQGSARGKEACFVDTLLVRKSWTTLKYYLLLFGIEYKGRPLCGLERETWKISKGNDYHSIYLPYQAARAAGVYRQYAQRTAFGYIYVMRADS